MESPEPLAAPAIPAIPKPPRSFLYWVPTALKTLVVGLIVLACSGIAPHMFSTTSVRGAQTKAFAQAKHIGLALRLYAEDHDGVYPTGVNSYGEPIRTSNDAFRNLFPTYTESESLFGNKQSAYQTRQPDNVIAPPYKILQAGENVYSYVAGLTDKTPLPETTPLVVDGTDGTGLGLYVSDPLARGGVWKGARAIVIHLDNSGVLETLTGPVGARYVARTGDGGVKHNVLDLATLGANVRLLDPAVVPPELR